MYACAVHSSLRMYQRAGVVGTDATVLIGARPARLYSTDIEAPTPASADCDGDSQDGTYSSGGVTARLADSGQLVSSPTGTCSQ